MFVNFNYTLMLNEYADIKLNITFHSVCKFVHTMFTNSTYA
jgi:hypothetical protein